MHKMSNLEYSYIAGELGRLLAGKHFSRLRKIGESLYRMKIGSSEIIAELGVRIHETRRIEESREGDKFTDKAEKELGNARLLGIEQVQGDRILSFLFDKGSLIFEMFGEGNAMLVRDKKIVCAHRYESWSDREIRAGAEYRPPKTAPTDRLEATDKYIIVSLMKLPIGKDYALEALARCGIDEKTPGTALSGNKLMELEMAIAAIKADARPVAFVKDGKIADFALAPLSKHKGLEVRVFPTLSEAADEYYSKLETPNPKLEKLLERLGKQKERLSALREEEKDMKAKGDYIYGNYARAEEAIALAKKGGFAELEKLGAKIDKKEKSVEIEL